MSAEFDQGVDESGLFYMTNPAAPRSASRIWAKRSRGVDAEKIEREALQVSAEPASHTWGSRVKFRLPTGKGAPDKLMSSCLCFVFEGDIARPPLTSPGVNINTKNLARSPMPSGLRAIDTITLVGGGGVLVERSAESLWLQLLCESTPDEMATILDMVNITRFDRTILIPLPLFFLKTNTTHSLPLSMLTNSSMELVVHLAPRGVEGLSGQFQLSLWLEGVRFVNTLPHVDTLQWSRVMPVYKHFTMNVDVPTQWIVADISSIATLPSSRVTCYFEDASSGSKVDDAFDRIAFTIDDMTRFDMPAKFLGKDNVLLGSCIYAHEFEGFIDLSRCRKVVIKFKARNNLPPGILHILLESVNVLRCNKGTIGFVYF